MEQDKIFARVTAGRLYAGRTPQKLFGEDLPEYIRKDALLEWAQEYLDLKIYDTKRAVMEELIDKLNSM